MNNIVTVNNVTDIEFSALIELLHSIYCRDIPEIDISSPINLIELERLMIFFSNQYAYMAELWGRVLYDVRQLKRLKAPIDSIEDSMSKRDYLEKVMSTCKLKADKCSVLLRHHSKGEV